jgi:hypothetical protein
MLPFLVYLVAIPAADSPALGIPALADISADDGSRAVADGSVAAAGVLPLPLPLLLPKPLSVDFSLLVMSSLLRMFLLFLT